MGEGGTKEWEKKGTQIEGKLVYSCDYHIKSLPETANTTEPLTQHHRPLSFLLDYYGNAYHAVISALPLHNIKGLAS